MAFMLGESCNTGCNLLLSPNQDFCANPEKTEEGAVRWQREEAAHLFCMITACG